MLKTLIADDESHARKLIVALLANEPDVQLLAESADGVNALACIRELEPDLVFMDIKMPGLSGLQVSRLLQAEHPPYIIFTTAYAEHALDAFAVDAVDYLLKPIDDERFRQALAKARNRLTQSAVAASANVPASISNRIAIKDGLRLHFFKTADIAYVKADGNYLHIHATDGKQTLIRGRLRDLEQQLGAAHFVRISRSVLLNLEQVVEMKPQQHGDCEFVLRSAERFLSGITYRDNVRRLLTEFSHS